MKKIMTGILILRVILVLGAAIFPLGTIAGRSSGRGASIDQPHEAGRAESRV